MVETIVAELGGLHIAVNNAGLLRLSAAEETSEEEWDTVFAVNTKGVFLCCQVSVCLSSSSDSGHSLSYARQHWRYFLCMRSAGFLHLHHIM